MNENHMIFLLKYGNNSGLKEEEWRGCELDRRLNRELR